MMSPGQAELDRPGVARQTALLTLECRGGAEASETSCYGANTYKTMTSKT